MSQSKKTEGYTKGEWRADVNDIEFCPPSVLSGTGSEELRICTCYSASDASRIVHCVNMHDELVGALEAMTNLYPNSMATIDVHARSILAKAKVE